MTEKTRGTLRALAPVGLILILAGTALLWFRPAGNEYSGLFRWVYAAGALWMLICRLLSPLPADAPKQRRAVARTEAWVAVIFCTAAFFLFYNYPYHLRDWLAFTLAGAILQVVCSWVLPGITKRFGRG